MQTTKDKGKSEHMPKPDENKKEGHNSYTEFLSSIGIDLSAPMPSKASTHIKHEADFDSFVAYDFETTGFDAENDSIIEVGAVKVVDGILVESEKFQFQEFIRPYKKRINVEVTRITGITNEDVEDARAMWEVIPDFMRFVGDSILVGYNNVKFDSKFLARAGRYSNLIIENQQFDVMTYVGNFKAKLGLQRKNPSLGTISEILGITNPRAHRALADSITTAEVYLRLRAME